eukprot:TRINITY_DN20750_c0_g1_i1.p1 TRINITY_DN20750_c0_g1~~TRINITY_DN20750_c0_g1_i1.p1  ORF type:complete len:179 (+),score=27.02 TRINITY_DN20750_c0_g1_i1:80-538(+)
MEAVGCMVCVAGGLGLYKCVNEKKREHEDVSPDAPRIDEKMVSSTNEVAGYRVVENLGIVRGLVVRSRGITGNFAASFQTIAGGDVTILSSMCEKSRFKAFDVMCAQAAAKKANAVVGFRFDATELGSGITEVLAYGTAVRVEIALDDQHQS